MQIRVVITGGPSGGKTTLLQMLHKKYCNRVAVAPEAANILFSGGLARPDTFEERLNAQRMIYNLQKNLENQAIENTGGLPLFCDRGSLDGSAYWPGSLREFCFAMGTSIEREMERYTAVLHLQSATASDGYTNTVVRTETAAEAVILDQSIADNWGQHPNYIFMPNQGTFIQKLNSAMQVLAPYLPASTTLEPHLRYATASDLL